jgi:hypothetical protein
VTCPSKGVRLVSLTPNTRNALVVSTEAMVAVVDAPVTVVVPVWRDLSAAGCADEANPSRVTSWIRMPKVKCMT